MATGGVTPVVSIQPVADQTLAAQPSVFAAFSLTSVLQNQRLIVFILLAVVACGSLYLLYKHYIRYKELKESHAATKEKLHETRAILQELTSGEFMGPEEDTDPFDDDEEQAVPLPAPSKRSERKEKRTEGHPERDLLGADVGGEASSGAGVIFMTLAGGSPSMNEEGRAMIEEINEDEESGTQPQPSAEALLVSMLQPQQPPKVRKTPGTKKDKKEPSSSVPAQ
jgi:hypothetical protein